LRLLSLIAEPPYPDPCYLCTATGRTPAEPDLACYYTIIGKDTRHMALKKGERAPAFTLYDTERKSRSLSEFLGKKTVLVFYPGAFTGCARRKMCTFRDSLASFESLKAQVVGISIDSPFANKAFAAQNNITFPF